MSEKKFSFLEIAVAGFVGLLVVSNIVSQKFMDTEFMGLTWSVDTGTLLLFPLLYIFGDILVEVWGYHTARRVIWYGFTFNIIAACIFTASVKMPHSEYFIHQEAFAVILGATPGLVISSMGGYLIGSFANSFIMARMKEWMIQWDPNHRFLPVRTITSTIAGEFLDTAVFVGAGVFFGIFPAELYISLTLTQWAVKTAMEVVMTPVTVMAVKKLKEFEVSDVVGTETYNPFAFFKALKKTA